MQGPQHPAGGAGLRRGPHVLVPSGAEPRHRPGGRLRGSGRGAAAVALFGI